MRVGAGVGVTVLAMTGTHAARERALLVARMQAQSKLTVNSLFIAIAVRAAAIWGVPLVIHRFILITSLPVHAPSVCWPITIMPA
jgi:hypothetical protein